MELDMEEVREQVKSDLNEKRKAVSGGAVQRNAEIIEKNLGSIQFIVIGEETDLGTTTQTWSPSDCVVCNGAPSKTIAESFLRAPFKSSEKYFVPCIETHTKIRCTNCVGSGNVQCDDCEGKGTSECRDCWGDGYEERRERCEVCNGESNSDDCQACGGSGTIEYRETCRNCDGTGRVPCSICGGDGITTCLSCNGTGNEHEYKAEMSRIDREFNPRGLPSSWSEDYRKIGKDLNLPISEFTEEHQKFEYRTEEAETYYITYEYRDDIHRVMVTKSNQSTSVVWDPETSYPETSWRRKIGDLKSRFLW